ncbi:hypothetical protein [Nakamurella endophytica]|uniref:Uncharacterized protein n=1 Tax=Nakamurella endophytica TaxID=1748367 RepID=A0A917SRT6_9ACTN|nr:hypothetical protein [Nakamurella endophytica]GGL91794.1 hypothetical protein GCM10011594_09480 [Nakamurella endophytica]
MPSATNDASRSAVKVLVREPISNRVCAVTGWWMVESATPGDGEVAVRSSVRAGGHDGDGGADDAELGDHRVQEGLCGSGGSGRWVEPLPDAAPHAAASTASTANAPIGISPPVGPVFRATVAGDPRRSSRVQLRIRLVDLDQQTDRAEHLQLPAEALVGGRCRDGDAGAAEPFLEIVQRLAGLEVELDDALVLLGFGGWASRPSCPLPTDIKTKSPSRLPWTT